MLRVNAMLLLVTFSSGFLLDKTVPTAPSVGSFMTDEHYNFVMQFIYQERQSRLQLEQLVKQLQSQVSGHELKQSALISEISVLKQKSNSSTVDNNMTILVSELRDLQHDNLNLKSQNTQLKRKLEQTNNKVVGLEREIVNLKQLQSIIDLQTMSELQNRTEKLEKDIKSTNNQQNAIKLDAEARKQDFMALYQQIQQKDSNVQNVLQNFSANQTYLENSINKINSSVKQDLMTLNHQIKQKDSDVHKNLSAIQTSLDNAMTHINSSINMHFHSSDIERASIKQRVISLESSTHEINQNISNKAMFSACSGGGSYTNGQTILFKYIKTSHGITNLSRVQSTGTFICEKAGFYILSFFITTNTNKANMNLYINETQIARATKHGQSDFTTYSLMVVYQLKAGDVVSVRAGVSFYDWGCPDSFFTVVQVI